jgi:anti-sigma factor RsiW
MIASEHLQPSQIDAFADHELSPDEARALQQHLATCHPCSLRVLSAINLKHATAAAGQRFDPSSAMLARLTSQLQQDSVLQNSHQPNPQPKRSRSSWPSFALWPALAAALLLAAIFLGVGSLRRLRAVQSAELLDQHLATLSSAATPQVLSTDRHTVKPWFEGKLPFSFNLPEPTSLPPGTALKGADLSYLDGRPAALLLFSIGKHQVSVFVAQRSSFNLAPANSTRSGFTLRSTTGGDLRFTAVGDVDPPQLDGLLSSLASAQQPR